MTIKEKVDAMVEQRVKELQKREAKDLLAHPEKKQQVTSAERQLEGIFWRAVASRDPQQMYAAEEKIKKDYEERGLDWHEKAQTVGTVGSGTAGGILVPTTVSDKIISKMIYVSPMRQIANVIPNMPAQLQLPSENTFATAYWVGEGVAPTETSEIFDPNLLTPFKAAALDSFTSELLADAATNPAIQDYVESRLALALAVLENAAFVNGDGSNKPYGFRSSAITPNSIAQQGDTVQYVDCTALKYSIKAAYRAMSVYVTSSVGMQALENVRDNYGRPIYRQSLVEDTPDKLLGRPIYLVDEIPQNLGTGGSQTEIWFGLFGQDYVIGDRGPLRIDYGTNASDFANDKISLRVIKRVAGRPVIGESFTKLTGVQ